MSDLPVTAVRELTSAHTTNRASPLTTARASRRQVNRTPATAIASSAKHGTIAIVPPALPPNPGQPDANTAKVATAATAASAARRENGREWAPEQAREWAERR